MSPLGLHVKRFALSAKGRNTMKRMNSPPLTEELAAKIKHLLDGGLFQHQIAGVLGINQGRVSEVKNGRRFPNVPPDNQMGFDFG